MRPAERALGVHRVLEPAGVLPQAARRLDADPAIGPDEVRIAVQRLNLDAASFRQLSEAHGGDGDGRPGRRPGDRRDARQDAEPGHRVRRHAHRRRRRRRPGVAARPRRRRSGWPPWSRSPSPRCGSPTGSPGWDGRSEQVPAEGTAILFARSIAAVLPDDLPDAVVPGRPRRLRRARRHRPRRRAGRGAVGHRPRRGRQVRLPQPGRGPRGRRHRRSPGWCATTPRPRRCAPPGSPTGSSSPTPPTRSRSRPRSGRPADVTVVCVDVPGRRTRSDPGHGRRWHRGLLLHGHVVLGGGPGRGGDGGGRDHAGRQRLHAGARGPGARPVPLGRRASGRSSIRACSR